MTGKTNTTAPQLQAQGSCSLAQHNVNSHQSYCPSSEADSNPYPKSRSPARGSSIFQGTWFLSDGFCRRRNKQPSLCITPRAEGSSQPMLGRSPPRFSRTTAASVARHGTHEDSPEQIIPLHGNSILQRNTVHPLGHLLRMAPGSETRRGGKPATRTRSGDCKGRAW